ncbi:DNA polymerase III subunit beta [bacterium]|nr:DNA polymerase III subunit beta [bacterium]
MEFKITREQFLETLAKAMGVVEKKNTMPVLSNVLLEADKHGLKVSATDLEVTFITQVPATVSTPGKITVSCRSLHDIVREIRDTEIKLTLKDNDRIEVKAGSSLFKIPGLNASEFPQTPKVEADSLEIPCELFLRMIEKTAFSMSTDDTRHNLAGILLQKVGDGLRMVSTDGHRLSVVNGDVVTRGLGEIKVIVPRKGISELKRMVSKEGSFELAISPKNIFARKGNESLFIRLVDGDFPDYERVVPKGNTKLAVIPREKLVGALRRVSLLSNEKSRGVVFNFTPSLLEVSITNPDLGEAKEEFDINYKSEKISVGFNARYFLDVLDVIKDESVQLKLENELAPCLIQSEKEEGFLSVIMPMRI